MGSILKSRTRLKFCIVLLLQTVIIVFGKSSGKKAIFPSSNFFKLVQKSEKKIFFNFLRKPVIYFTIKFHQKYFVFDFMIQNIQISTKITKLIFLQQHFFNIIFFKNTTIFNNTPKQIGSLPNIFLVSIIHNRGRELNSHEAKHSVATTTYNNEARLRLVPEGIICDPKI